jgi:hypothetical protein
MSLFNKMLFDATKGPSGFDQTVKVPPPVAMAPPVAIPSPPVAPTPVPPTLLPVQENTPMPEGIMDLPTNMMTAEQAAALSSFTSGPTGFVPRPTLVEERTPYAAPPSTVPTTYMGNVQTPAYTGDRNTISDPSGNYSVSVDQPSFFPTEVPMVATDYELKGLQPDRTGQNPFARPGPNTVSMQANETIVGPKDDLSQRYFAPQGAKYAEGGEVKDPGYFNKTADENYDIKDYLLDTIPKGISKVLLLNPYEGLDRQVGEELAGYVDTRMENYRARELQERLDRLYEGMTPEEIEAYKIAFIKNVGSSAP